MKSTSSTSLILWVAVMLLAVASLTFGYVQLAGLPELGVQFGPNLSVRAVPVDRESEAGRQEFKRGDRVMALEGQSVDNLRDLRMVLQSLPTPPTSAGVGQSAAGDSGDPAGSTAANRSVSYQVMRPLHRFPITLQGQLDDPTALPAGVEPSDRLVELDGRQLQTKVGPEAVRSIVASRPEALLVFERKNAVFTGVLHIPDAPAPVGVLGVFGVVLVVLACLWAFRASAIEPTAVVAVSMETLCVGWIALLAFQYQWTLSDYGLTAAVIIGFSLVRPTAFFGRNIGDGRGTLGGWTALGLGGVAAASGLGLLYGGYLDTSEQALHIAAVIAGLFLVYEIFLASTEADGPGNPLGDSTGYIAWILVLALFSALLAWYLAPISFEENRWRWFSSVIVGLVWFSDLLFCFRGPSASSYEMISTSNERRQLIGNYLQNVAQLVPDVRPSLVIVSANRSVQFGLRGQSLAIGQPTAALHDAVEILLQEGVRVPLPDVVNRQANPMGGIAKTMNLAVALGLAPPEGGIRLDDAKLVLVGVEESPAAEISPRPADETVDEFQHLLAAPIWTAALIEGVWRLDDVDDASADGGGGSPTSAPANPDPGAVVGESGGQRSAQPPQSEGPTVERLRREIEALRDQLADSERQNGAENTADSPVEAEPVAHAQLGVTGAAGSEAADELAGPPACFRDLLEPELVDALNYLLESTEPIVLAGAAGTGKSFTARCANAIDETFAGGLTQVDMAGCTPDDQLDVLFGESSMSGAERAGGIVEANQSGAVLIRSAQQVSDPILLRICQAAELGDIRVYLSFDASDAEDRSVLAELSDELRQILDHRELVVPRFCHRPTIMEAVLEFFLADYAERSDQAVPTTLSAEVVSRLNTYEFADELTGARAWIDNAAAGAAGCEELTPAHLAEADPEAGGAI